MAQLVIFIGVAFVEAITSGIFVEIFQFLFVFKVAVSPKVEFW